MREEKRAVEIGAEDQYARARRKKGKYLLAVICMAVLPVVGYIFDIALVGWDPDEVQWIPINLGIYSIMGISACYIGILIVSSLVVFVKSLNSGGLLAAIFATILFYGVGGTVFVGAAMLFEKMTPYDWFGAYKLLQKEIGGPGEILGVALIANTVYLVLLFFALIELIRWSRKCRILKEPAAEARAAREESERRQAEEQERRGQEKRKEEKQNNERFFFFENCTTRAQLDARYKSLMRAYHPDTQSGDEAITKVINAQYEEARMAFGETRS